MTTNERLRFERQKARRAAASPHVSKASLEDGIRRIVKSINARNIDGLDIVGPRTTACKEQVLAVVTWLANPKHLQDVYHACEQTFNLVEKGYADESSPYTRCHRDESRIWAWVETYLPNHSIG